MIKNVKFHNKQHLERVSIDELALCLAVDCCFSDSKEVYQQTYWAPAAAQS